MDIDITKILKRSDNKCELCEARIDKNSSAILQVPPLDAGIDSAIVICKNCENNIKKNQDPQYWRFLSNAIWSPTVPVQVTAYRILKKINNEYSNAILDTLYLEPEVQEYAQAQIDQGNDNDTMPTKDSNGTILSQGDSVTIIKDLEVKGAKFTAKRGTVVKNIILTDNHEQVEAKINSIKIVLLSRFLKKI